MFIIIAQILYFGKIILHILLKLMFYKWIYPVDEILKYEDEKEIFRITDKIIVNHYPDYTKSRSNYLPLLELSAKEQPTDDKNMHYLGRKYMYYQKRNKCIDTLIQHLNLPTATWKDEKCASMRFIARSYQQLKHYDEARMWLNKAILEAPYLRDPYIERAILEYNSENWYEVIYYIEEALKIKSHAKSYINEPFSWDQTPYDLLSIAYFNIGNFKKTLENINLALETSKDNERLKKNKKIIEGSL